MTRVRAFLILKFRLKLQNCSAMARLALKGRHALSRPGCCGDSQLGWVLSAGFRVFVVASLPAEAHLCVVQRQDKLGQAAIFNLV